MRRANSWYSASVEDLDTVGYFLDFHATKESRIKTQNPVIGFLVDVYLPQLASIYADMVRVSFAEKRRPCLGDNFHTVLYDALPVNGEFGAESWLRLFIAKAMSSREIVRYINLPNNLLY